MRGQVEPGSDEALVAGLGERDQGALAEIYRRHSGAVWAVAERICASRAQAERVCEEVFTELWSRPERFDPEQGSLRSWLVGQAHARAGEDARPERDALVLTHLGGLSCRETANVLGVSEDIVKTQIRLGLLDLRRATSTQGVTR